MKNRKMEKKKRNTLNIKYHKFLKAHKDKEREKRLKLNIHFSQELPFIN